MLIIKADQLRKMNAVLFYGLQEFGDSVVNNLLWPKTHGKKIVTAHVTAFLVELCEKFGVGKQYRNLHLKSPYAGYKSSTPLDNWDVYGWHQLVVGHTVSPNWVSLISQFPPPKTRLLQMRGELYEGISPYIYVGKWLEREYNELESLGLII